MGTRLAAAALALGLLSAATDRQTRTFPLPPGRSLNVEATIGAITIAGEPRQDAMVEIVRHAPTPGDLERIPVRIDEDATAIRITALQADEAKEPALRTEITLRVPVTAALPAIRLGEGKLTVTSLHGEIGAFVRRGPIEATDVQGIVRLETEIGDIQLQRARLSPNGLLRLRTFNGDVRLHLAERPAHARILALSLNGTIASDIPLHLKEGWGPRWGEATLGEGEPVISIDAVTGHIEIKTSER